MNETLSLIFELFINLFQGMAFTLFCNFFFTPKFSKKVNFLICTAVAFLLFTIITVINFIYPSIILLEVILYLLIMIPFSVFCHEGKLSLKIIMPLIIFILLMGIGMGYSSFLSLAVGTEVTQVLAFSSTYHIIHITICNATYGFLLFLICRVYKEKIDLKKPVDIISFIVIPLLTLTIVVIITTVITDVNISETNRLLLGIIALIAFAITFVMFSLMKQISKAAEITALNSVMIREQNMYKSEIANKNAYIEEVSFVKHEMKRKLYCINELLKEGKIKEAQKICENTDSELNELSTIFKTDNLYLNSILNLTYKKAANAGVKFVHTVTSGLSLMDGPDLMSILGNLIDNAFEALEAVEDEKLLKITILEKEYYYIIAVKNSIAKPVLASNPNLKTTKTDKHAHGHGIKIVKNITSKYKGNISFNENDSCFAVNIMLQKPNNLNIAH